MNIVEEAQLRSEIDRLRKEISSLRLSAGYPGDVPPWSVHAQGGLPSDLPFTDGFAQVDYPPPSSVTISNSDVSASMLRKYSHKTKVRFFADGDVWCAVFPDFKNVHESTVGFGDTQMDALIDLLYGEVESLRRIAGSYRADVADISKEG